MFLGRANGPAFYAIAQCPDQIDFLVPDGCKDNLHAMKVHSHHHYGRTGSCPAQRVLRSALASHRIVDDIIAAQEHLVAQHTLVELCPGGPLYFPIAILRVDNLRAHTCSPFHLESMTCHYTDLSIRS